MVAMNKVAQQAPVLLGAPRPTPSQQMAAALLIAKKVTYQ